ncbi:MAG: type II toxin-antitoxin system VapC family toxin [Bauldia sp.]|nr:type II toxin-antitoxin system VapC family toxin [Bauldia sp.]
MVRYLLDTNIASDMIRNPWGRPARRHSVLGRASASVSIIVAAELRFGATKKMNPDLTSRVEEFLDTVDVISFDPPADAFYAMVRADLEARGQRIGSNDLFIAAHALALDRILVTNNDRDFGGVNGLVVENWLR